MPENFDGPMEEPDDWQECPVCEGGHLCKCQEPLCKGRCCPECGDGDEPGLISTVRYVEIQNEKLERRRSEGWAK